MPFETLKHGRVELLALLGFLGELLLVFRNNNIDPLVELALVTQLKKDFHQNEERGHDESLEEVVKQCGSTLLVHTMSCNNRIFYTLHSIILNIQNLI